MSNPEPLTNDAARYIELRSEWSSEDDAFIWLVQQLRSQQNGESTDGYSMTMAARDIMIHTLINNRGYDVDAAVEYVSKPGQLLMDIFTVEGDGEFFGIMYQPTGAAEADTFSYRLDSSG